MDSLLPTHAHTEPVGAPCGHLVHFYSEQNRLLDLLETFIADGLVDGEGVIVIATPPHLHALESRLQARGIDLVEARHANRYLPMGTHDAMARFVVDGWPESARFEQFLQASLQRARGPGRRVRAFGEMVAVMWAHGRREAALELERLWSHACAQGELTLLCAYPSSGFGSGDGAALDRVRALHTDVAAA
jgi:hypothetical protein